MMAYREPPPQPGLPFPRKNLALFGATAIASAALMLVVSLSILVSPVGWRMFGEGGWVLLPSAFASAVALGTTGIRAARGTAAAAILVAGVPALVVIVGVCVAAIGMRQALVAASAITSREQAMRMLTEAAAESDVLSAFGCGTGAAAFGSAALGLLGAAASVDHRRAGARAGGAWVAPLILGPMTILAVVATRGLLGRSGALPLLVVVPSLVVLTVLATLAARNAKLVRAWHDAREAKAWLSSLLAAATASAASVVLIDVAALLLAERSGLSAISGASLDASQKARVLAELVAERRAALLCACVAGAGAFAIVASGLLGALGRGPEGRARLPLGARVWVLAGGIGLMVVALFASRAWAFRAITSVAGEPPRAAEGADVSLPPAPSIDGLTGEVSDGARLTVHANGTAEGTGDFPSARHIILRADRRARWLDVARALQARLRGRFESDSLPSVSLAVAPRTALPFKSLGNYEVFVRFIETAISVELAARPCRRDLRIGALPPNADMEMVVAAIATAKLRDDARGCTPTSFSPSVIVLAPPTATW